MKMVLQALMVFLGMSANAATIEYVPSRGSAAEMIKFSIPYTMGTHDGVAESLDAVVATDENDNVLQAQFRVPIDSLKTGDATRDCHLVEALGIDYSQSKFPKKHVCNSHDKLPESGPDSVKYPDVVVEFLGMTLPKEEFVIGVPQVLPVSVMISMHGVEKTETLPVSIVKTINEAGQQGFKVISKFNLLLSDFAVQVKPLKIGFIKIGVENQVSLQIAIDLVSMPLDTTEERVASEQ